MRLILYIITTMSVKEKLSFCCYVMSCQSFFAKILPLLLHLVHKAKIRICGMNLWQRCCSTRLPKSAYNNLWERGKRKNKWMWVSFINKYKIISSYRSLASFSASCNNRVEIPRPRNGNNTAISCMFIKGLAANVENPSIQVHRPHGSSPLYAKNTWEVGKSRRDSPKVAMVDGESSSPPPKGSFAYSFNK